MCKEPYTKPTKVCKMCEQDLPVSKFNYAGKHKAAYQPYCKICQAIRRDRNRPVKVKIK